MRRAPMVTPVGWVDPNTGKECRRSPEALKLWKYYHKDLPEQAFFFAVPGVNYPEQAADIGHEILILKVGIMLEEE